MSALPVDGTFPDRDGEVRKAEHCPGDSDLGSRHLHPVRALCAGLSACGDSHEAFHASSASTVRPRASSRRPWKGNELADHLMTIQVAPDDCTGCGVCVDVCPAKSKEVAKHKAINMVPKDEHLERERANWDYFLTIPEVDRTLVEDDTVKSSQMLQPLFEFSGACAGLRRNAVFEADEPVVRRSGRDRQRDRLLVDLRRQPADDAVGREPRGSRAGVEQLAVRRQRGIWPRAAAGGRREARLCPVSSLKQLADVVGETLVRELCESPQTTEAEIAAQRERVEALRQKLVGHRLAAGGRIGADRRGRWSGAACGSSAATAGPTTSALADSTMC